YTGKEGFAEQPYFTAYTLLLAAYTFVGGYRGERFLARISGGRSTDYHASAAVPYIIATGSAAAIVYRYAGQSQASVALAALALVLAGLGVALRATGLKFSAVTALAVGAGVWFYTLNQTGSALAQHAWLWPMLLAQAAACIAVERSFFWRRESENPLGPTEHAAQVVALLIAGGLGAGTLSLATPPGWRTVLVFAHAFAWIGACVLLVDPQFRWTALLVLLASVTWLAYIQRSAVPGGSMVVLVATAAVLLAVLFAIWFILPHRSLPGGPHLAAHK
ncbi:MAG: hypothetical protein SGI88_03015, partial [Candidatus Hydrogenedentes bacterium]|nr:hypothetical protein [Candidatus Hydrogenedentota bacterium]